MKNIKKSYRAGFSFGITSGIITTLGLIVGLAYGTNSKLAIIGGILSIAIADAMSDALGMHLSIEAVFKGNKEEKRKHIWESSIATFFAKLFLALSFLPAILFFKIKFAIILSIIWGLLLLSLLSFLIAKAQEENPAKAIAEHITIACIVIIATYFLGQWIARTFT